LEFAQPKKRLISALYPSPNFWRGRPYGAPIAVVIHTMAGSLGGCDAWFTNPASQVSAHFGVSLDGVFHRYVDRHNTAWANGLLEEGNRWPGPAGVNPNYLTISIETEDLGDSECPVSDPMYSTVRTLVRTVQETYPEIGYLMGHSVITPQSRPGCPGSRWLNERLQQLADDCNLSIVW
jgi:N-acetylmuramoyl-L-alanine amidase